MDDMDDNEKPVIVTVLEIAGAAAFLLADKAVRAVIEWLKGEHDNG